MDGAEVESGELRWPPDEPGSPDAPPTEGQSPEEQPEAEELTDMSEMTDRSADSPDVDGVKSNGTAAAAAADGGEVQNLGVMQSLRRSMRRAAEKLPLPPGVRGSKVTPGADTAGNEPGSELPPSPSPSAGSAAVSPRNNLQRLLQRREDDDSDAAAESGKPLKRSKTDPGLSTYQFLRGSLNRSLKFVTKKDKDGSGRQEPLIPVPEASQGEKTEDEKTEDEKTEDDKTEDEKTEDVEEVYTLPELPPTPLSVMQISKLIEMEVLEEAHLNLLALRHEFQQELERSGKDTPMELVKKEKDLNLLYRDLRNKVNTIVRDANSRPSRNKGLLVPVAHIIQGEERRAQEAGGLPDSWMEAWREAVGEGVQVKVASVHLEPREQNPSWLACHLGLLGKAIVEDLEGVKKELKGSYPSSFGAFSTYVRSYHRVVGQHLRKLEQQVTELKDLYALLDWVVNRYKSERIMGHLSLQPEMGDDSKDLQLEENFLQQLKEKYCCRVKADLRSSLDGVIKVENEDFWMHRRKPETEDDILVSALDMDIWTRVKGAVVNSRQITAQLEQEVIASCLEELKLFPKRFEAEFKRHCSALHPQELWTLYQITYINSFTALQRHMETYLSACPVGVEDLRKEVKWLTSRLLQGLEEQFKEDVKPFLGRMMTRNWLSHDHNFDQLYRRTERLSEHCSLMAPPHAQEFASHMHYHVVRQYIGQLLKNNYSCKNLKHEKAAAKISWQWEKLVDVFQEMKSTHQWLNSVGDDLSDIIGQKNKADIKDHLEPVVLNYPDFSSTHLLAVLSFRGPMSGRESRLILQRFAELTEAPGSARGNKDRVLFGDMQANVNTDCLSSLMSFLMCSCCSFLPVCS